jgi:hypothetical protein
MDGLTMQPDAYAIECKHVGGRESIEVNIDRWQPQLQWIMFCTKTKQIALSTIEGANEPRVDIIDRDDEYIAEMVGRGRQFMNCVEARKPPVVLPAVPPPVVATKSYDMTGSNAWSSAAATWLATKAAARDCSDAEKRLKAIVPDDARKVTGYGVVITRDRAGRLSLRELVS